MQDRCQEVGEWHSRISSDHDHGPAEEAGNAPRALDRGRLNMLPINMGPTVDMDHVSAINFHAR